MVETSTRTARARAHGLPRKAATVAAAIVPTALIGGQPAFGQALPPGATTTTLDPSEATGTPPQPMTDATPTDLTLCRRAADWDAPKRVSAGAIRGGGNGICAISTHVFWGWIAQLEKKVGGTYQEYGSSETGDCQQISGGDFSLCAGTDGAPFSAGRYRVHVTFWSFPGGLVEDAYTPSADIK